MENDPFPDLDVQLRQFDIAMPGNSCIVRGIYHWLYQSTDLYWHG